MRAKALALLALLLVSAASASPVYNVIDLGTLNGGIYSHASSINNSGQIVGEAYNGANPPRAILFDSTGSGNNRDLGTVGGSSSSALSINNNGQIVGVSRNASGTFRATLFDSTGSGNNIDLGTLGGSYSYAWSINDNGQIVGYTPNASSVYRATLFDSTGSGNNIDLGTLGGSYSRAYSINNSGQIVGFAYNASNVWRATLFDSTGSGNNIDLGTPDDSYSRALSINNNGQIVGYAYNASGNQQATLFDSTGSGNNIDLGTLPGYVYSVANSINNSGQIVGTASNSSSRRAMLFDSTGSGNNIDLNTLIDPGLGWTLQEAYSINDNGWIVGYGLKSGVSRRALLLTPEPSTPPIADADGPYSIFVGDTLTLDGSGSTDADDDIVSYMWDLNDDETFETDAGGEAVLTVDYTYLESLSLIIDHTYTVHLKVTDSQGQSDVNDSTLLIIPKPATVVAVDIKPDSCPNPLNVKSSGVLPVAVLGSADVNVLDIDPTSIAFSIGDVNVGAIRCGYEDVAAPVSDSKDCNCITEGSDGFLDLTLKFKTQRIVEAIGDVNDGDVRVLALTGVLFDPMPFETPIEGADCIVIRGRHKPFNEADINKDGVVNMTDFTLMTENWLQSSIVDE